MTVRELMDVLAKCNPDVPVIMEVREYSAGSSQTGIYCSGTEEEQIETASDLETRVVLSPIRKD